MKKLTIQKHSSTHNTSSCPNRTIKYIVIHYTAGLKSHAGKGKDVSVLTYILSVIFLIKFFMVA